MRNQTAKKIRKTIGLSIGENNPILRRNYRRFKKLYIRTPEPQKSVLLQNLQDHLNIQKNN